MQARSLDLARPALRSSGLHLSRNGAIAARGRVQVSHSMRPNSFPHSSHLLPPGLPREGRAEEEGRARSVSAGGWERGQRGLCARNLAPTSHIRKHVLRHLSKQSGKPPLQISLAAPLLSTPRVQH